VRRFTKTHGNRLRYHLCYSRHPQRDQERLQSRKTLSICRVIRVTVMQGTITIGTVLLVLLGTYCRMSQSYSTTLDFSLLFRNPQNRRYTNAVVRRKIPIDLPFLHDKHVILRSFHQTYSWMVAYFLVLSLQVYRFSALEYFHINLATFPPNNV
jgi:hypothetical protein